MLGMFGKKQAVICTGWTRCSSEHSAGVQMGLQVSGRECEGVI